MTEQGERSGLEPAAQHCQSGEGAGRVIAGKYEIIRKIGSGGMGSVYEARNTVTLKRVALKLLALHELGGDGSDQDERAVRDELAKRFLREAQATSVIESDHVVEVFDSGVDPATQAPYMVLELLRGEELEAVRKRCTPLPPAVAAKIVAQAATGLAKAHAAGILHRDIKPANIYLVYRDLGDITVKLLDFGIAKVKMEQFSGSSTKLTRSGMVMGTPQYMSPEQARGVAEEIDARTDVWSLGIVLYELLTGATPLSDSAARGFGELLMGIITQRIPPVRATAPWVPEDIAAIVDTCLKHEPEQRYTTAGPLRDALMARLSGGVRLTPDELVRFEPQRQVEERGQFVAAESVQSGTTERVEVPAGTGPGLAISQSPPAREGRWGGRVVLGAAAFLVFGMGAAAWWLSALGGSAGSRVGRGVAPDPGHSLGVRAAAPASAPPPDTGLRAIRSQRLEVTPKDAHAFIGDVELALRGGAVELAGRPGEARRVRLVRGASEREFDVRFTAAGLEPSRLFLPQKPAAAPLASVSPAAPPTSTTNRRPPAAPRVASPAKPAATLSAASAPSPPLSARTPQPTAPAPSPSQAVAPRSAIPKIYTDTSEFD